MFSTQHQQGSPLRSGSRFIHAALRLCLATGACGVPAAVAQPSEPAASPAQAPADPDAATSVASVADAGGALGTLRTAPLISRLQLTAHGSLSAAPSARDDEPASPPARVPALPARLRAVRLASSATGSATGQPTRPQVLAGAPAQPPAPPVAPPAPNPGGLGGDTVTLSPSVPAADSPAIPAAPGGTSAPSPGVLLAPGATPGAAAGSAGGLPVAPSAPQVRRNAQGEPLVTNSFADTDLKQALADITAQTGVPIIADATVQGTVTLDLADVPLERALEMLLRSGGFAYAKVDGYYLAGLPEPTNPNFYLLSRTEVVQLRNVRPEVILSLLAVPYGRYLSSEGATPVPTVRGSDAGDSRRSVAGGFGGLSNLSQRGSGGAGSADIGQPAPTYKVSITAPPSLIERIKADIDRLDQGREQVMLEALVLEISQDDIKDLGFNFASRFFRFNTSNQGGNFAYSSITNDELVQISALAQRGAARVRANPRVTTGDGQTAEVEVGRENYFTILTGSANFAFNTLEVIRSGITLRITPRVIGDPAGADGTQEVQALVEPEVRDVTGRSANGLPEITFRRAATNVRVKTGESIVIGGLINEFDTNTTSKIPLLGDIPVLGKLFRGTNTRRLRTETIIIITPRILRDDLVRDGVQSTSLQEMVQKYRDDNRRAPGAAFPPGVLTFPGAAPPPPAPPLRSALPKKK